MVTALEKLFIINHSAFLCSDHLHRKNYASMELVSYVFVLHVREIKPKTIFTSEGNDTEHLTVYEMLQLHATIYCSYFRYFCTQVDRSL